MKWFMLIGTSMLCAGCGCYNTEAVNYAPVSSCAPVSTCAPVASCRPVVRPVSPCRSVVSYKPVVSYRPVLVSPVIEPVQYSYSEPLDVRTAVVDFY